MKQNGNNKIVTEYTMLPCIQTSRFIQTYFYRPSCNGKYKNVPFYIFFTVLVHDYWDLVSGTFDEHHAYCKTHITSFRLSDFRMWLITRNYLMYK